MTSFSAPLRSLTLIALAAGMAHAAVDITSVSPNHGVITGGTVVVITGTGLSGVDTVGEVKFGGSGGVNAASIISSSATQIVVTTPAGMTQGALALYITDGTSNTSSANFIAYETNTATLDINISVSIAQTLYLAWTAETIGKTAGVSTRIAEGDTSAVSWDIGAVTVAQLVETATVTSAASPAAPTALDVNFEVRNTGNGPIDLAIRESNGAAVWTRSSTLTPATDIYVLAVMAVPRQPTWAPIDAVVAASAVEISPVAGLAPNVTQAFDLLFQAPTSVTSFGAKAMTVTVVATIPD